MAAALQAAEVKYQIDNDGDFRVGFELESGRSQSCIIRSATYEFLGVEIREISSAGLVSQGPFDARTANILLQQNEQVKLGAWGVISDNEDTHAALLTRNQLFTFIDSANLATTPRRFLRLRVLVP